jgi:DNA-binding CsgD family transcriptional regulator/PAS domain-containing protein
MSGTRRSRVTRRSDRADNHSIERYGRLVLRMLGELDRFSDRCEDRPVMSDLARFGDLVSTLERLSVPLVAVGRDRIVIWENAAARELTGGMVSQPYLRALAPESRPPIERDFARSVLAPAVITEREVAMLRRDGSRVRAEVSAVPFEANGYVIGFFGAVVVARDARPAPNPPIELTPRQAEILRLLARGASTQQIEAELGISRETVRNHIRALLRRLHARSRLEAVVIASGQGLL